MLPLALAAALTLSVSPARIAFVAPASRTIDVRNTGSERVQVTVGRKALDGRGAKDWLTVRPARLLLRGGAEARVTVRAASHVPAPGDHGLLLLLVAQPLEGKGVAVRLRLGVPVRVRVPGLIVHRLRIRGLAVRKHKRSRDLLVSLANVGNVTEQLRGQVTVTIMRRGRVLSRLRPPRARELFPGRRTLLTLRYAGGIRGPVTAVVKTRDRQRRYRLRL
jgi:hypothetical protein